ncbi:MAG: phenylalanine--tRNA ligase subunit alpha [Bacteroidia bacterium]
MFSDEIKERIESFKSQIQAAIEEKQLRDIHVSVLGRNGWIKDLMGKIKDIPAEARKDYGQLVNTIKDDFTELLRTREAFLLNESLRKEAESLPEMDLMIPMQSMEKGTVHPLTIVEQEIIEIFKGLGFSVASGPEMEMDYYNFEALNIPAEHPARDMQDTFWLENGWLLRTHTSSCQVRAMEKYGVPIRVIAPGRTFRNEAVDASHENTFHQVEGLMVDKGISVSNLIYVLKTFLGEVFKKDITVRLRPGFFPFVEPGFELDIRCIICGGGGCQTCGYSGWIELVPCGMVHRRVLEMSKVDPDQYTGFAFGLGISRLVMMKYNIPDIRVINRADLRELRQFDAFI